MVEPANGQERKPIRTPDWARNASKMYAVKTCDVLKRSVWCGCDTCGRRVLNAFIYEVTDQDGMCNTGLMVVCSCMTLYLLLNGSTTTYPDLEQVCLPPCGFNDEGVMEGDGGAVQWTDKSFQEVQHYVCVMMSGEEQCSVGQPGDVCDFSRSRLAELLAAEMSGGGATGGCPEGKADTRRTEDVGGATDEAGEEKTDGRGDREAVGQSDADVGTFREGGNDPLPPAQTGEVKIVGDYKVIRIGSREINLALKYKARDVLRFMHARLKGSDGVFCFEEVQEDYNTQFGKDEENRKWRSERFREDLFKGLDKEEFDCLFETLDQAAGRYRLKI